MHRPKCRYDRQLQERETTKTKEGGRKIPYIRNLCQQPCQLLQPAVAAFWQSIPCLLTRLSSSIGWYPRPCARGGLESRTAFGQASLWYFRHSSSDQLYPISMPKWGIWKAFYKSIEWFLRRLHDPIGGVTSSAQTFNAYTTYYYPPLAHARNGDGLGKNMGIPWSNFVPGFWFPWSRKWSMSYTPLCFRAGCSTCIWTYVKKTMQPYSETCYANVEWDARVAMESNCAVQLVHQILDMSLAKGIFPVQVVRLLRGSFRKV